MRVLILNQYGRPTGSAGITRHGDIGAELVRRGHEVTIVASSYDYLRREAEGGRAVAPEITPDGVRFVWLRTGSYTVNDRRRVASILRYTWKAGWATARLGSRPDVILASSPHPLTAVSAAAAAWWRKVPWVFEARDIWPAAIVDLGAIKRGSVVHRSLEWLERFAYRTSDRVVVVPPQGELRFRELGLDTRKVMHIPNGTNPSAPIRPLPATLQRMLDNLSGKTLIVYAGAMGVPNGVGSAIAGMSELRARHPVTAQKVALMLVGAGVHRDSLVRQAQDAGLSNVFFHEPIEKGAVSSLLARADACLMQTSASDHFKYGLSPNKLFDYLAAGRPVLISSVYPTIVDDARAGIRFTPGNRGAFADAVRKLLETPIAERNAMGERGRALVTARYTIATLADQYEQLFNDIVQEEQGVRKGHPPR